MTAEGIHRINPDFSYDRINLYVAEGGKQTNEIVDELRAEYAEDTELKILNFLETIESVMGSLSGGVAAMCTIFVVITVIVVSLIVVLIMKMKMVRERKTIGIYKALGYTTGQIVWQSVMAFAPVVTLGGVVGSLIGAVAVDDLFVLILSFCEIKNASLRIHAGIVILCMTGITMLAFAVSALVSSKARKMEAYQMIVEE